MTRAGHTEARKVGVSCSWQCSSNSLLSSFPVTTSFTSSVSQLGSILDDEEN